MAFATVFTEERSGGRAIRFSDQFGPNNAIASADVGQEASFHRSILQPEARCGEGEGEGEGAEVRTYIQESETHR